LEAKLTEAFDLFDHERNKTIDFRELGTVIRAVGGVPTEAEVLQLVRQGASEEEILRALSVLDTEKKGYLTASVMETLMSTEGEPFTVDEVEEMLAAATDTTKGKIVCREYAILLTTYNDELF
uniref:EF-hand domain-containing protein n=1 Tax=Echinostoma caproni TaxID=27848 RepID=A0A183BGW1_9TREM